jgi:hypothetical protein
LCAHVKREELANVMERVALMTDAPPVDPVDLALQALTRTASRG